MKFISIVVLFTTLFGLAITVKGQLNFYAQFYSDNKCTDAIGEPHSIFSPQCFSQPGSGSVRVPNTGFGDNPFNQFALYTSDSSGNQQCLEPTQTIPFYADGTCIVLNKTDTYMKFAGPCGFGICP